MIEDGEAAAILDISKNDERLKTMYFPKEKISDSASVLFHLKAKPYTVNDLNDLKGLTIGTQLGYNYTKDFDENPNFTRDPVNKISQNYAKLKAGRVDMYIANRNVGLFDAKTNGYLDEISYLPKAISGGDNFVAFSKKKVNKELVEKFSETLKKFKTTDEYKKILAKYGQ